MNDFLPTSSRGVIQCFASKVKAFPMREHRRIHDALCRTAAASCPRVLLAPSQSDQEFRVGTFDYQVRPKRKSNCGGERIGCLPAIQRPSAFCRAAGFQIIAPPEGITKQSDRAFVDHPALEPFVVNGAYGVFALRPFDADVSFSVNKSGKISKGGFLHARSITHPRLLWTSITPGLALP